MTRPPLPPTAPPRAPREEEYKGAPLAADRRPENQIRFLTDDEGYVVGAPALAPADGPVFLAVLKAAQRAEMMEIVWPAGWLRDADGRGYTVMEMQQVQAQDNTQRAA